MKYFGTDMTGYNLLPENHETLLREMKGLRNGVTPHVHGLEGSVRSRYQLSSF